jgi:hypothetical protein
MIDVRLILGEAVTVPDAVAQEDAVAVADENIV